MTTTAITTGAGLGPRAAARAVDTALLVGVGLALGAGIGFGYDWFAVQLVLVVAYLVGLTAARGATVGKARLGLRVVAGNGYRRPTVTEAAKREAFALVGAVPVVGPLLALVGWTAVAWSIQKGDAVHDRFAGTDVVRYGAP